MPCVLVHGTGSVVEMMLSSGPPESFEDKDGVATGFSAASMLVPPVCCLRSYSTSIT